MSPRNPARLWLLLLGFVASCGGALDESRSIYELERMAFVQKAPRCQLKGLDDCSIAEAILVDRFELTRADWRHYQGSEPVDSRLTSDVAQDLPGRESWPAYLSHVQAQEIAQKRGMRLLWAREWIHVATGGRSQSFPNGQRNFQASVANTLELELGRPAPVGTFESGRSRPFGCYDMIGNVWEWVADLVPAIYGLPEEDLLRRDAARNGFASAMGGSYQSAPRPVFETARGSMGKLVFHALSLDVHQVAPEVGARFGADAAAYLLAQAPAWGNSPEVRARLRVIGRTWGRAAVPFLTELIERPGAHPSLGSLLEGASDAARAQTLTP